MGLLQKSTETYDNHVHLIGQSIDGSIPLSPISHIVQTAQIEIDLDLDGELLAARKVPKKEGRTIIPATEESAGRTGDNDRAHPLSDQLRFLMPGGGKKYNAYLSQLGSWAKSPYSHPKVRAVYAYIQSGHILDDLAQEGVIQLNKEGNPSEGKIEGKVYGECMVRWIVHGEDGRTSKCWEDQSLFTAFDQYYRTRQSSPKSICIVSGKTDAVVSSHPKGVLAYNYNAKLISANKEGFTYLGRFTNAEQAGAIGYEASQKAHNALQWIVANEGVSIGGRMFVWWSPKGSDVPQIIGPGKIALKFHTNSRIQYQKQLRQAISGYRLNLPEEEDVVAVALDAATTGRLSITYYNELKSSDFLDRLEYWFSTCCWINGKAGYQSPSIQNIALLAFGVEREEKNNTRLVLADKLMKEQVQRLFRCVVDQAPIPADIEHALVNRVSNPMAYSKKRIREQLLFTACAVIQKYHYDHASADEKKKWIVNEKERNKDMNPNDERFRNDRSYQYGRMLAVLELVERRTYDKNENREPNAIRLRSVFCRQPQHYTVVVNERVEPYLAKLNPNARAYYRVLMQEISEQIQMSVSSANELNRPLEDTYLLGYFAQRKFMYTKKEEREAEAAQEAEAVEYQNMEDADNERTEE